MNALLLFSIHIPMSLACRHSLCKPKMDPWQCFTAPASWIYLQMSMSGIVWVWCLAYLILCFEDAYLVFALPVRLVRVSVQGCFFRPLTFPPTSSSSFTVFFIVLHPTFASLSASVFFYPLWYFPRCVVSQFSQSTAYATVCICNLITDAPNWQQVQLCMDVCLSLISQEILSCVVQNVWMCVLAAREMVFSNLAFVWKFLCSYSYSLFVIRNWSTKLVNIDIVNQNPVLQSIAEIALNYTGGTYLVILARQAAWFSRWLVPLFGSKSFDLC